VPNNVPIVEPTTTFVEGFLEELENKDGPAEQAYLHKDEGATAQEKGENSRKFINKPENAIDKSDYEIQVDERKRQDLVNQIREKLATIPELSHSEQGPEAELIQYLIGTVAKLKLENSILRNETATHRKSAAESLDLSSSESQDSSASIDAQSMTSDTENPSNSEAKFVTVHLVYCLDSMKDYYLDPPRMFKGDSKYDHFRGLKGIENITKYLERHQDLAFAVIDTYDCRCHRGSRVPAVAYKDGKLLQDAPVPERSRQYIALGYPTKQAIQSLLDDHPARLPGFSTKMPTSHFSPFLFFFNHNKILLELADSSDLTQADRENINLLCKWFEDNCRDDWDEANELFSRGKVNAEHHPKLFRPDELLVESNKEDSMAQVFKSNAYPWDDFYDDWVTITSWEFNGKFQKGHRQLVVENATKTYDSLSEKDGEVDITSLAIYPMRFAEKKLYKKLVARGQKFWDCRKKKLVSYMDPSESKEDSDMQVSRYPDICFIGWPATSNSRCAD
jgi:hypothetical protein